MPVNLSYGNNLNEVNYRYLDVQRVRQIVNFLPLKLIQDPTEVLAFDDPLSLLLPLIKIQLKNSLI